MLGNGEAQNRIIRPEFNRSIVMDFLGAKITSDAGFLPLREIDERFKVTAPMGREIDDPRSPVHIRHSMVEMIRQRVYQIAAGYEDCSDADQLRIDPALRLALGKDHKVCAGQSMMSRLENDYLGNGQGLVALEKALARSADALLRRKNKRRLIVDLDSTEDPAHGQQEKVAYNGHFGRNCFHPLFAFTSQGDCLAAKLRPGNVHSADGTLDLFKPIMERYRSWFQLFWFRGDAAFANPKVYEYCEDARSRVTYFIRLPANQILQKLIKPHLKRPVGRPPKNGLQVKIVDFRYQAKSWNKPRRVVCKIEWHQGELFPRSNFIVTNSRLPRVKVVKVYNGRGDVPPVRGQPGPSLDGRHRLQSPPYAQVFLRHRRGRQAFYRVDHQAADKGRSQGDLSWPEVARARRLSISTCPPLPDCLRLTMDGLLLD